jgi:hypothetical protein
MTATRVISGYAAYIVARERGRTADDAAKHAAVHMENARR